MQILVYFSMNGSDIQRNNVTFLPNVLEYYPVSLDESLMPENTWENVDVNDGRSMDSLRAQLMDRYLTYMNMDCVTIQSRGLEEDD